MNKLKLAVFAGSVAAVAAISILAAQAVNPLAVTCAGNASGTQIMWTATSTGGNAPVALLWSGDSKVAGSASVAITGTYSVNGTYTAMIQATDASSSIATSTCMATVTANVIPTPTSMPTRFMPPMLNINPGGHFLAHGLIVTSVSVGSFQGTIWGITYTVNWTGHMPEFLFRGGKNSASSPSTQLNVGDEVGVSGKIDPSAPFIVNAEVVRDYSIIKARPKQDNGGGNDNGQVNRQGNGTSSVDAQSHINELLNQLHNLQNLFKHHGGGNE